MLAEASDELPDRARKRWRHLLRCKSLKKDTAEVPDRLLRVTEAKRRLTMDDGHEERYTYSLVDHAHRLPRQGQTAGIRKRTHARDKCAAGDRVLAESKRSSLPLWIQSHYPKPSKCSDRSSRAVGRSEAADKQEETRCVHAHAGRGDWRG